ncbi:MAG TPA: serine--tRNA ligase [Candidatus Saccharibacteria bacterium]|nr:serine--tRNA ligase [Candidatus Saccharibacteria bacterium]
MHDLRVLFSEEQFPASVEALDHRGFSLTETDQSIYQQIHTLQSEQDSLRADKNQISAQFRDSSEAEQALLRRVLGSVEIRMSELEESLADIEPSFHQRMLSMPNVSAEHVPIGESEEDNEVISTHGEPRTESWTVDHLTLGTRLGIIDNKNAANLSGTKFSVLRNKGALLKRALVNFMLDQSTGNGYEEVEVPYLVRPEIMQGTGQLPKFEDDMFTTTDNKGNVLYLIPTTEVPLTNLLRDKIFTPDELPYKLTGYSENFRREAGKAGQDTKGLIRNHQFPKIELVRIAHPENSWESYYEMIDEAKFVLEALKLPSRTIELCTGDLGIAALSTRDLEVWLPSQNRYLEVSSVSNTGSFQARRMGMKFKDPVTGKREFVHTLNGTAVAVGRTMACILENCQNPDGSVDIPEVLQDYTKFKKISE